MTDAVEVWVQLNGIDHKVGTARFAFRKNKVSTTFAYEREYMALSGAFELDSDLLFSRGGGSCSGLPRCFQDASPDRWGRKLIEKEHREKAGGRLPRQLTDVDYLLGVSDATRQGALRFSSGGKWLGVSTPVPPVVDLHALLEASRRVANDTESHAELKALLDVGTTALGGAHPKASVRDGDKLLLAKFSHPQDNWDVVGLEKTMLDLQEACGIDVPSSKLVRFGKNAALLTERFDRAGGQFDGSRLPYKSAMTLLEQEGGAESTYFDLISKMVSDFGMADVAQMLKRVCFSYVFNNTDDHLKNHGFLYTNERWRLSPAFDVNPTLFAKERATLITGDSRPEHEQFLDLCDAFDLERSKTAEIVSSASDSVRSFDMVAKMHKVPAHDSEIVRALAAERIELLHSSLSGDTGPSSSSRKPSKLKDAGEKPKQPREEKATPGEDGRACSTSAAARGAEAPAHEVKRQK